LPKKILIVDDEEAIVRLVSYHLERDGYHTVSCYDGATALKLIRENDFDLVILDIMLPELSGWDVLRIARNEGRFFPVIFLSARNEEVDRVAGLELGADDYVTKPFSPRELVARVRAQLRRADMANLAMEDKELMHNSTSQTRSLKPNTEPYGSEADTPRHIDESVDKGTIRVGCIAANEHTREVFVSDKPVDLTAKEFDLLVYMMKQPRIVFTRGNLLSAVWGYDFEGDTRTVDVHISRLRQKIDPLIQEISKSQNIDCPESFLETVRGVGYKLISKPDPKTTSKSNNDFGKS